MNIRILSYNIHKGTRWRNPDTLSQIQAQLVTLPADFVFLQEVKGHQFDSLKTESRPFLSYGKNVTGRNGHHGNVILSKYPIIFNENTKLETRFWDKRGLLHVIVQLPDNQIVHLLCTHLSLFEYDRRKQLVNIVKYINDNVHSDEPIILGGDFNDWRSLATSPLIETLAFQEAFLNANAAYARTFPAWIPTLQLDRLYYRGFNLNFANRLTQESWRHLSDHLAIDVSLTLTR